MNSKGKGIITAVIVVLIALAAFCGFGYISQRMTASEGITYLDKKEYQKAYEQFDHAAGKFTLIFTKQKKEERFLLVVVFPRNFPTMESMAMTSAIPKRRNKNLVGSVLVK